MDLDVSKLSGGVLNGKTLVEISLGSRVLWEAGNFRTADGMIFKTADGMTFNTKKSENELKIK